MWYSAVFLLFICNCFVNAQFAPPFQGCGCNGPLTSNFNCQPTNIPFPFQCSNAGCNSRCPNFTPINSPCFNFPSFSSPNFNNPKGSNNIPVCNDIVPLASESSSSPVANDLSCAPKVASKPCEPIVCDPPSQISCPAETTPCPVIEAVSECVPEPTTTTEAPIEAVIDVVEEVVEVVEEIEEVVETIIEEAVTTSTCPPCASTASPEIIAPPTICEVTAADNVTTPCSPLSCPSPIAPKPCDCNPNPIQSATPIACQNMKLCSTQTSSSCPASQFTNSFPVQCTCPNSSPNSCTNSYINASPSLCISPLPNQCPCPSPVSNPYPNQCVNLNANQLYNAPCPNICPNPSSNPCPNFSSNPCPNPCPTPCSNPCFNPCPTPCPNPCSNPCLNPYPNSFPNTLPYQLAPPCQTQNLCPEQYMNNVPCEFSTMSQIPNSFSCMPPNGCCSGPNNGVNFEFPMSQPNDFADYSSIPQNLPFCTDPFSGDGINCGNNIYRQSNFNCQPNLF